MLSWESLYSIAVGGLAAHVSELAEALHRRGHEVHVFTRLAEGLGRYDSINEVRRAVKRLRTTAGRETRGAS